MGEFLHNFSHVAFIGYTVYLILQLICNVVIISSSLLFINSINFFYPCKFAYFICNYGYFTTELSFMSFIFNKRAVVAVQFFVFFRNDFHADDSWFKVCQQFGYLICFFSVFLIFFVKFYFMCIRRIAHVKCPKI
ncbi:hypothetical protein D3C71_1591970 [compost metagenome]